MWRSSIGISRSLSAGLPASITKSRTRPLRPVVNPSQTASKKPGTVQRRSRGRHGRDTCRLAAQPAKSGAEWGARVDQRDATRTLGYRQPGSQELARGRHERSFENTKADPGE